MYQQEVHIIMCVHVCDIFTPHIKGLNCGNVPNLWLGKTFTKFQLEFTINNSGMQFT